MTHHARVRSAMPSDAQALAVLDAMSWPAEVQVVPPQPQQESFFTAWRQPRDVFVAESSGPVPQIVGCLRLGRHINIPGQRPCPPHRGSRRFLRRAWPRSGRFARSGRYHPSATPGRRQARPACSVQQSRRATTVRTSRICRRGPAKTGATPTGWDLHRRCVDGSMAQGRHTLGNAGYVHSRRVALQDDRNVIRRPNRQPPAKTSKIHTVAATRSVTDQSCALPVWASTSSPPLSSFSTMTCAVRSTDMRPTIGRRRVRQLPEPTDGSAGSVDFASVSNP